MTEAIQMRQARHRLAGSRRRDGSGLAIIEMAIALPVLLYLVMGMVEFGQFFYLKNAFQQAARDALRAAIMPNAQQPDPATAATRTLAAAGVTFQPSWMVVQDITPGAWGGTGTGVVTDCSTVSAGHALTVTITATYAGLPGAVRPLSTMTGGTAGINATRTVVASSGGLKE